MTEAELIEFAHHLRTRWDGAWRIDGRPIGTFEMCAMIALGRQELQQLRDSGECCCDEGPTINGRCRRGAGKCELFTEARKILWRSEHVD